MKPILFARIADMKYYHGTDGDTPYNGGSYVQETGQAHECCNFWPVLGEDGTAYCLGFAEIANSAGGTIKPEKIIGCEGMKGQPFVDGVLVIFVSRSRQAQNMRVVGFYRNATVFSEYQAVTLGSGETQTYSFLAKAEDCVLLPYSERHSNNAWYVPAAGSRYSTFGFGRSHIWYAQGSRENEKLADFLEHMITSAETYTGENWLHRTWTPDSAADRR